MFWPHWQISENNGTTPLEIRKEENGRGRRIWDQVMDARTKYGDVNDADGPRSREGAIREKEGCCKRKRKGNAKGIEGVVAAVAVRENLPHWRSGAPSQWPWRRCAFPRTLRRLDADVIHLETEPPSTFGYARNKILCFL